MKLFKLTDERMSTYCSFQYELGVKAHALGKSNNPCSAGVIHAYADPRLAVIFNPIHSNFLNPRLFEAETDTYLGTDECKCWCKALTLKRELPLPVISIEQKIEFAIRSALVVYNEYNFNLWAESWLSNVDRSKNAANAAAYAAYDAATAENAANAANAAAYAADAANAAAYAAYDAADAANAENAANAATATYAAYAANAAAYAAYAANAAYAALAGHIYLNFCDILDSMGVSK